jgi:hypothetical protein
MVELLDIDLGPRFSAIHMSYLLAEIALKVEDEKRFEKASF